MKYQSFMRSFKASNTASTFLAFRSLWHMAEGKKKGCEAGVTAAKTKWKWKIHLEEKPPTEWAIYHIHNEWLGKLDSSGFQFPAPTFFFWSEVCGLRVFSPNCSFFYKAELLLSCVAMRRWRRRCVKKESIYFEGPGCCWGACKSVVSCCCWLAPCLHLT